MTPWGLEKSAETSSPLQTYLDVLKRRWRTVVIVCILTFVSGAIFTAMQTPVFLASAMVAIDPEPPRVMNIPDVATDTSGATPDYFATQLKLIQSRPVVEAVIQRLNLKQRMPHVGSARDPYSALMHGPFGGITIEPIKSTRLVLTKFEDPDPVLATEIANAIASQYVRYGLEVKQAEAQTATVWLNQQIESLRAKALQSSRALQAYQAKADLLGLQDQRQITQAKLIDSNRAYLEAQNLRIVAESRLRELGRIAKDPSSVETLSNVINDPLIQKLKTEASDLQIERSKLAQVSRAKHPDLLQLDAQIQEVNQRLQTEVQKYMRAVETDYKVAKSREDSLFATVNELRREARSLNDREAQAQSLQHDKDSADDLQATVLKRLKETGLASALTASNIRVVEPATKPTYPVHPRVTFIRVLSIVCGLALGTAVAFLAESLDNRVRSQEDILSGLGVPIVGVVPVFRARRSG